MQGANAEVISLLKDSFEFEKKHLFQIAATQYGDGCFLYSYKLGDVDLFPLWFIHIATEYIKETGRFDILDENLPFIGKSFKIQLCNQYGAVSYSPGESPLYYHLEYAFDTFCKQLSACSITNQDKAKNIIAAGLFSLIGKDFVKLCSYSDIYFGACLAAKKLRQITSAYTPIFSDISLLPDMRSLMNNKDCHCGSDSSLKKCFCKEIGQFVKSQILGVISLFSKKTASEFWLETKAAWTHKEMMEWIIGIKPGFEGLCVDPCIPDKFPVCEAERYFRNAVYSITVVNPDKMPVEIKKLTVDQVEYLGNTLPNFADGKFHTAEIIMGP